ncbi:sporulation protein [Planococcus shixiaomingii]|uniref:sporulation protein n=1 Tax=Planococcus shixiaomingii TaxID=3058393 RepID=UPI00261652C6|nr:sporulation protein [Planococcus sp. N022]WKA53083.1 sporulation protein [Planococcus sp. N022]
MSFFDNVSSSAGTENAKVDTYITEAKVKQGSTVSGEVYVLGGESEQHIKGVYLSVMTSVLIEENNKKSMEDVEIQKVKVSEPFTIAPKEEKTISFSFILSPETPMTVKRVEVWFKTTLDVSFECDPRDKNYIHVVGTEAAEKILDAIQQLDFPIKRVVTLKSRRTYSGVVQEFEFYTGGNFKKNFSEMEMVLISDSTGTTAYIELDRHEKETKDLIANTIDRDEAKLFLHYRYSDVPSVDEITNQLQDLLLSKVR